MIPISDDNPTLRTPIMTYLILGVTWACWFLVQGFGMDMTVLATSVCNLGMVPGELTGLAPVGTSIPLGEGMSCVVDDDPLRYATPLTSMFMHGSWAHIIGNSLFMWVFGNNVEDSTGRGRFLAFYIICGLAAAGVHAMTQPGSPVPTVGASGAISGVMGAYMLLYPRVRVNMLFPIIIYIRVIPLPAWLVLIYWFVLQVVTGLPELLDPNPAHAGGVAVWAHVGGFVAGVLLIKLFEDRAVVREREQVRHRLHPDHP